MAKSTYKPLKKSRANTSGKASAAKREGEKKAKKAKDSISGKSKSPTSKRLSSGTPYKRQPLKALSAPRPLPDDLMVDQKGLKLRSILRQTPKLFHNNARYVKMLSIKKTQTKSGLTAYLGVMRTDDPYRDKPLRKRNVSIVGLDPDSGLPVNRQRVLLQCTCENYVFTYEYANTAHNAARLIFSNGMYPGYMNSQLAPGACKHLIAFAHILIEQNR